MATREEERRKDLAAKLSLLSSEQEERLAKRRAEALGLPHVALTTYPIDADVLEVLPKKLAKKAQAVLFYKQGKDARMGVVNPELPEVAEAEKFVNDKLALEVQTYVISDKSLQSALARYRREKVEERAPEGEISIKDEDVSKFREAIKTVADLGQHITQLSPTELLSSLVSGAIALKASDVHVEPYQDKARLRYRIDGVLQDISEFPLSGWRLLLSRVKVLSDLKLNVHAVPQDGSFVLKVGEKVFDIRVSILPGGEGENIVMRVLDRDTRVVDMQELGMKKHDYDVIQEQLKASNGMILMTGPTGSGKTTSLASFLMSINNPNIKIITLENPIEYRLPGVEQTQIDHEAGYTFAAGLRAILRQDPDVILVGEIRDEETAATAMHAALTGHLVFSTLHTNDAPGAVPRLADMKVEPHIAAPALNLIIAQRLVRRVCSECAEEYVPSAQEIEQVEDAMRGVIRDIFDPAVLKQKDLKFVKAQGCEACNRTGYTGRVGIFEVLPVTDKIEDLILAKSDGGTIQDAALKEGMTTIAQDGYLKVLEQITTIDEVERVTEE